MCRNFCGGGGICCVRKIFVVSNFLWLKPSTKICCRKNFGPMIKDGLKSLERSCVQGYHIYDDGSEAAISLCEVHCLDPPVGGFYTCIDVDLECYTKGNCHYECASSNACCGCTLAGTCNGCNVLHDNLLHCHHGDGDSNTANCIQVRLLIHVFVIEICFSHSI